MSGIKDTKRKREQRLRRRKIQRLILIVVMVVAIIALALLIRSAVRSAANKFSNKAAKSSVTTSADKTTGSKKAKKKQTTTSSSSYNAQLDTVTLKKKGKNQKKSDSVSLTISSAGDCTLGTDENFSYTSSLNAYYDLYGADYFFKHVKSIFEKDDLSIVNMEGTLTEETTRELKTYAFKGPVEYTSILSGSSIEAANLANNHSSDYGVKSYSDTIKALEDAGVSTFGYNRIKIFKIKGVKVGVTGIYELEDHQDRATQVKENIKALKKAGAQIIIINFHWGAEKVYVPDENQKALAHLAIDEGADLVIGHHPHVLEGVEKYKGKYIAYSLGNFCFGGNSNPEDTDSMIVQQTFTIKNGKLTKSSKLKIIPCSITSSSGYNDYCPAPLTGSEKKRVLKKVEKYSEGL